MSSYYTGQRKFSTGSYKYGWTYAVFAKSEQYRLLDFYRVEQAKGHTHLLQLHCFRYKIDTASIPKSLLFSNLIPSVLVKWIDGRLKWMIKDTLSPERT